MQLFVCRIKKSADAAGSLSDALFVFDKGQTHIIVAMLAKTNARRNRHISLFYQQF